MKDIILKTFSSYGFPYTIAMVGFSSGIVTMFVNTADQLSVKWMIFSVLTFSTIILILFKIIFDLSQEIKNPKPFEIPISYIPEKNMFIIRKNENFVNSTIVGCYLEQNYIEDLAYLGVIHHVQDNVIQIKIEMGFLDPEKFQLTTEIAKKIIIRPVIPIEALNKFNLEN